MPAYPSNRLSSISNHLAPQAPVKPDTYRERSHYKNFMPIQTRWSDNDMYGHINNMYFYQFMASVVNGFLLDECGLELTGIKSLNAIIVQSSAEFYAPMSFPSSLEGGMMVARIGTSSVKYRVGIFNAKEDVACVVGEMTHVYVDPATKRPVTAIPNHILPKLHETIP